MDEAGALIVIDVDGVLNVTASAKRRRHLVYHHGWVSRHVDAGGLRYRLLINPAAGPSLRRLAAETDAELAWGTTWEEYANLCVAPLAGLPRLRWAPCPDADRKADGVVPWTRGRPFVWFDDDPGVASACARLAAQRHLVVTVDEHTGLTEDHVGEAHSWLSRLAT